MPISFYVKSGEDYLHATLWIPKGSRDEALVFCHGWGGGSQYDDLLETLAGRGYYALRFHQRGYGKSTGKGDLSIWATDMAACAATLKDVAQRIWAAGQSTGGAMALIAAATQDGFAGAVSLAPFCSLQRIVQDNKNARPVLEEHFGPLQEKHFRAGDTLNIVRELKKPVLIVHGTADDSVPFEHGRLLSEQLAAVARFVPVAGGNHHLKNVDRSGVITEIINWLESNGG